MDRKTSLFFDLCRLCLDKPGFTSIGMDLSKDIAWCTGVKVTASENLPKKICYTCLDVISNAKKLKEVANKNDMHLRSLFGDLEEEQISDGETNHNIENISSSLNVGIAVSSTFRDEEILAESNENTTESTACSPKQNMTLNVRRDLFEPSSVPSSTVKDVKFESEEKSPTNVKDMKFKKLKVKKDVYEYQCLVCTKRFDKWKKYYLHQRFHNKNIFCPLDGCGKKFAAKGDLEKHIRTHTGEKPFQCSICPKTFSQRGSLKSHMDAVHAASETVIGD